MQTFVIIKGEHTGLMLDVPLAERGNHEDRLPHTSDRAPQPFRKNIVQGSSFPIHTHVDIGCVQKCQILRTGEVASLITVPDDRNGFS